MKVTSVRHIFIVFMCLLSACSEKPSEDSPILRPIKSITVSNTDTRDVRVLPGLTQAADQVTLSFQVTGKLQTLPARAGQRVNKGQILAQLDDRDYVSLAKAAQAELDRAESEFERMESLLADKLVSQSDFDQKKAARDIAQANLERANKALADTRLVAPFSGIIAQRHVENFEDITAKQEIVSMQSLGNSKIVVRVPESRFITDQNELESFRFDASFLEIPNQSFSAEIIEFSTVTDPRSQTFEVTFQLTEEPGFTVLSGMNVSMRMSKIASDETAEIWVPASAVFADRSGEDAEYVWLVNAVDSEIATVSKAVVETGTYQGEEIRILSGVKGNDKIAVAGVHYLQEGQQVRLVDGEQLQ